jgi:hypothetical protein
LSPPKRAVLRGGKDEETLKRDDKMCFRARREMEPHDPLPVLLEDRGAGPYVQY